MEHPSHTEHLVASPYSSPFEERAIFFLVLVGVFSLTYGLFFLIDFLPEKPQSDGTSEEEVVAQDEATSPEDGVVGVDESTESPLEYPYPIEIVFDALGGRTVAVKNPEDSSVAALDAALLQGVVRHPDSADFEKKGTIFLFGHSSYLPNVINKNFQAFNGIEKMVWGDIVRLRSEDTEYVYRVDRVYEVSANDAEVTIEAGKEKLTLVTCDTFGAKSDRFVVEASLVSKVQV